MTTPNFNYDELSDTLYIYFEAGAKATGIELNDTMLLRLNKDERKVVGLTLFNYSILAQTTEMGWRSFPLTGLLDLSAELQAIVLETLQRPPLQNLVTLSAYTPSFAETMPIMSVQPISTVAQAD